MTKKDTMAKLPGLHLRQGVWQLRTVIPKGLQAAYGNRTKIMESLGTGDAAVARTLGTVQRGIRLAEFDRKRAELNPQRLDKVTPELAEVLAQRVTSAVLGNDERLRADPEAAKLLLTALRSAVPSKLTIGAPGAPAWASAPTSALEGLSRELADELRSVNEAMDMRAAEQMATQRIAAILPMVKAEAAKLGVVFDERTPGALEALRGCLRAYRVAWRGARQRDQGEVVDTPPTPARIGSAAHTGRRAHLRDVLPQWKASKPRKPQTIKAAERALAMYEEATGNPPLDTLTRAHGIEFRGWLQTQGTAPGTAADRLNYVKGFLNFAARDLELIPRNPWSGIGIEVVTVKPRRPWSIEQLNALAAHPLFASYALPKEAKAGLDGAYWIPLLGAFTGARVSELAQLRPVDVETVDGVPILRITNEAEGSSIKTEAGRRVVPVHPELRRLGFLDYVAAMRKAGADDLWPTLPRLPGKAGHYFSGWFSEKFRRGWSPALPDFHSLRHTVRSRLASAEVAEPTIDALMGHEVSGSTGARTYTARTTEDLARAIGRLAYPGLSLPRVFKAPAWKPPRRGKAD